MSEAKFAIGQIVHHKLFDYRGVVFDIDFCFQGSDEWYESVAKSRPPRNRPWYRVLVDSAGYETYVAEQNLESSTVTDPIHHPDVQYYFSGVENGVYIPLMRKN